MLPLQLHPKGGKRCCDFIYVGAFHPALVTKNPSASAGDARDAGLTPGWEDPLKHEMATHSRIRGWKSPWMEEPGGLGHGATELDTTELFSFPFM